MSNEAVCFIIGPTGVGKTKMSLQLARACTGEVVSSDSMQVYEGADVMTAKVSPEERREVPHHLLDVVSPLSTGWHVGTYQHLAVEAIAAIHSRGHLPFVVGGTMYYVEALLFDLNYQAFAVPAVPEKELWGVLEARDPAYAAVTAKTNLRKIDNAVKYILATGLPYSQRGKQVSLRFPKTCVLWLRCNSEVLEGRIRERVETMVTSGGLAEVEKFLQMSSHPNFSKGVLQSIGYKEFHSYLLGQCSLEEAKEALIQSTLKYARKQEKWINSRLVPHLPVHVLDSSDLTQWPQLVEAAYSFLQTTLVGPCQALTVQRTSQSLFHCDRCHKQVVGESQWQAHLKSKAHRNVYKRKAKKPAPPPTHSFLFDEL